MNRTKRIQLFAPQDRELWQSLYYRHQQHSHRRRLLALKALWDGQSMAEVCRTQRVQRKTLERWEDAYLHGGFKVLLAPQKRPRPQALSPQRRKILRYILLHKAPADYGLDGYQWTAPWVQEWLKKKWHITLSRTRLYEIFRELGLSHQRAHRDYGPSKPGERAQFVEELQKVVQAPPDTAVVAVDEFALKSSTDTHYAWAEKNTAPALPSDEKHREKLNGFLAVDLESGNTTVHFQKQAKTDNAVFVFALLVLRYARLGFRQIVLILDNCSIHGKAMKAALFALLAEISLAQGIQVTFLHTPVYSPKFNPAEYLIRLVRKNSLYHLPCSLTVQDRAERVRYHLAQAPPLTPRQVQNILRHIYGQPKIGWS